jgi:hypothetical protein
MKIWGRGGTGTGEMGLEVVRLRHDSLHSPLR